MHEYQMIGVMLAIIGIVDITVVGLVVAPRVKMPPQGKKLLLLINSVTSVGLIIAGAVLYFVGAGKS